MKNTPKSGRKHSADMKFVLTMTEEQAKICAAACEFYARVRMGQFEEITHNLMMGQKLDETWCERRDIADQCLLAARKAIYPDLTGPGHSYGIAKFEDADASFDVYQALREKFPWDGRPTFSYNDVPKCEVEDD